MVGGGNGLYTTLAPLLRGRVLLAGVGNPLRGDDGAGPEVVRRVGRAFPECCLDCGEVPENYLGLIKERSPDLLLFVDAVDFGGQPGETRICDWSSLRAYGWDTHRFPLRALADYLEQDAGIQVKLLGIQPGNTLFGSRMTEGVEAAVGETSQAITSALREQHASCTEGKPV